MRDGATIPAITQAPTSASASAIQTRHGGCSSKEDRAADHGQDRRDIADERRIGDLGAVDREVERSDVDRESKTRENQGNGRLPQIRRARPAAPRGARPDCEGGNRKAHAPGRPGERPDVEEAHEDSGPGDDRRPGDERNHSDAIGA